MSLSPGTRIGPYEVAGLLGTALAGQTNGRPYDVSNDGKRFIAVKEAPPARDAPSVIGTPMVFVVNWFEELKAKLPVK